jgi:two-component system OmpR family sensor kinase
MILLFCIVAGVFLAATYEVVYRSFVHEVRSGFDDHLLSIATPLVAQFAAHPSTTHIADIELSGQSIGLVNRNGQVIESSIRSDPEAFQGLRFPDGIDPEYTMLHLGARELRVVVAPVSDTPNVLVVAESTERLDRKEASFRERSFGLWTVSLLLTALIAVWYVGRSLEPFVALNRHVALLTSKASSASKEDIDVSLPIANPNDELGVLATNFNILFARVSAAVRQLRQFVSDAAHELRTPLSVVRGETQFLLAQPRSADQYQQILTTVDGELTVMVHIIEGLFTLSMADAGQLRLASDRVFLNEALEEACGIAAGPARRKNIRIERMRLSEIELLGDPVLLRQVFLILLENAVKYSPPYTTIRVGIDRYGDYAEALIEDEGYGISEEHLPHIFERFYRAAPQSSDSTRSGGLGLAIADAILRASNGSIRCDSASGKGSRFMVRLPVGSAFSMHPAQPRT